MVSGSGLDGRTLAIVVFAGFVTLSLLLCGLAATDQDEADEFYAGNGELAPWQNGLAIAGDYISAATVLSTTGAVAVAGYDGILFACAAVLSLVFLLCVYAEPLRRRGHYTLADTLAERLRETPVRIAMALTTLLVLFPLLAVQLTAAGRVMAAMFGLSDDALTGCTVLTGALLVCYSAIGGMRGTGYVQILKTVVVVAAVVLLSCLVLERYGWDPLRLAEAAAQGSGDPDGYTRPGGQFGDSLTGRLDLFGFQFTLILGAACMPHVTMRLYAVRSARALRSSLRWAVGAVTLLCTGVVLVGLGASALLGATVLRTDDPAGGTALLLVTGVLDPGARTPQHSVLFAVVACAVFATVLAAVAGITLAAASSLAHDVLARVALRRRRPAATGEIVHARLAVVLVGALAVALSLLTAHRNPQVLFAFTFAAAASCLLPVLLYTLFWRGFTTAGMLWVLCGNLPLNMVLLVFSPAFSGLPVSFFPEYDFHWFPLQTPGLVTIPTGFALGWLGCRPWRARRPRYRGRRRRGGGAPARPPESPPVIPPAREPAGPARHNGGHNARAGPVHFV